MPRSSRHKSSKHSTRDAREYSDSEKESYLRERKGKEDGGSNSGSRHLKDSRSGDKQKLDSRPVDVSTKLIGLGNAENNDDFGSVVLSTSRKRKEKADDDRWTGGDDNNELKMLKSEMKEKEEVRGSGESKRSSRRAANYVSGFDVEEGKKSGSKAESKHHHRSERKERGDKEGGSDRERKGSSRSDRSERLVDIVSVSENTARKGSKKHSDSGEVHGGKRSGGKDDKVNSGKLVDIVSVSENTGSEGNKKQSGEERDGKHNFGNTDCSIQEESKNPESVRDLDRRVRRKRDGSGDLDRHHGVRDADDRRLPSREEITKSGKYKDDVRKDERNRDRFQEDIDKDVWRQNEKQRDYRSARDYTSGKFDEKHSRNDRKDLDLSYKKSMPHGSEYERESVRDRQRDRDHDRNRGRDRDRKHDERDQDRDYDRDREPDRDRDHGTDRYRRERERELRGSGGVRDHDRGRDRNFDHENDNEYPFHVDEKGSKYTDDRGRRRSIDGYDDYHTDKLQRVKTEVDKERFLTHKPNIECITSSSQHRASPSSRAYGSADKYRDGIKDETKYVDTLRSTTIPETVDRSPKYWSGEKRAKCDDNHIGEFSERSPNTRVSPAGLKGSPSMSFDRSGFSSRNSRRRSLDVDDAERRISGSNDVRDMGVTDDRQQNLPSKKVSGDGYPPSESPFYHKSKSGQGHTSSHGLGPGQSVFRTRADSPSFAGSLGEDTRGPGSRYRRSVDPNVGRGPGNAWNSVPNWPSSLPNGYIPFPPGPPGLHHGGFPPMMSQFPPIYGVRPTLDINHQGIPYHLADGDRFQGHARPIGWPNMVEGSVPHFRGWDAGNGILRDDSLMYGPGHLAQRRDMNPDIWKQNGDMNMDIISGSQKHGPTVKASTDEASMSAHGGASKPNVESSCLDDQATSFKKDVSSGQSPMKEILLTPTKGTTDKTPESSGVDDAGQLLRAYLAKLDISMDLADPELYNQCINLSIKGEAKYLEYEVELEYMKEKGVLKTEITNLTVDMKNLPAAEESIYQRAMNLYKTQSSERRSYVVPELEKALVPKENIESAADGSLEQEQTLMLPSKIVPEIGDIEPPVSLTSEEVLNVRLLQNSDLAHDVGSETQMMPVLDVDKRVEETNPEFNPENAAAEKLDLSIENTNQGPLISNTDEEDTIIDGCNIVSIDSVPEKHSDFAVSGPLNLCNDSVKVCEGLTSVSNESESVVLSRIHHAPESTH